MGRPGRPSLSQRRAKQIVERSGGDRVRRGAADRLEVGSEGIFERTEGDRVLRVGGTLTERTGGTRATRARRVERTVRGRARIDCRADTILLGGAMSDVHAGAELVLAGMSDDLVLAAGSRITAPLDVRVAGLLGIEEKLATSAFDGAIVDIARTLFEREYGTGIHDAGSATFSGAVYATQATGFRRLMRVSCGVRNLSSGGGAGAGGESASSSAPSSAATSPGAAPEPGLLGTAQAPQPGAAGWESTDLARLTDEARSSEDAAHYGRAENVSETAAELQEVARNQVAGDSPEEAARAPSRMESASGPSAGSSPDALDAADPASVRPESPPPTRPDAPRVEPGWSPPATHERTYTKGQVPVGDSFDEFRFEAVVGARPDTLLSDDAQAALDTGAFRFVYDAKQDVTDMARDAVRHADPKMEPGAIADMNALDAHNYLDGLRSNAIDAGDSEEARRLQNLIDELDHYAFDHYSSAVADAEAAHAMTPAKLPANLDPDSLAQRLTALAEEQQARMATPGLSDAEYDEAGKLAAMYMMAAQDTAQGLDPLDHLRAILDSGLGRADYALYTEAVSQVTASMSAGSLAAARPPAARSLWARAGEIANTFLSFIRLDSRPPGGASPGDELSQASSQIRFLDNPTGVRLPDPDPPAGAPGHTLEFDTSPVAGEIDFSPAGSDPTGPVPSSGVPDPSPAAASRLNPTLDGDGAHWAHPTTPREGTGTAPWSEPPAAPSRREPSPASPE